MSLRLRLSLLTITVIVSSWLGMGLLTAQNTPATSPYIDPQAMMLSVAQLESASLDAATNYAGLIGSAIIEERAILSFGQWSMITGTETNLDGTGMTRGTPVFVQKMRGDFSAYHDPAFPPIGLVVIAIRATDGQMLYMRAYDVGATDTMSLNVMIRDEPEKVVWPTIVPIEGEE